MDSQGDPRVLFVMNLLLSAVFSTVVVYGLSLIGLATFGVESVALATVALMILTWFLVMR